MYTKPLVSVIIPTYNRAFCLADAIKSVLGQTYSNIEIIVIDGPSTDDTEKVINKLGEKKVTYMQEGKAKGAGAARNTGIKAAHGDYIAFQDSDNIWLSDKLEKQMKMLLVSPKEVGMIYTGYKKIHNDVYKGYYPQRRIVNKAGFILSELLRENFIGCQTVLIKKECFDQIGVFDEQLPTTEDWDLFLRISKCYKILCIDEPLALSYIQADSISIDLKKMITAFKLILNNHINEYSKDKKLLAEYYFNNIATILCENNQHGEGRSYILKAIKLNPLNVKYYLVLIISHLGNKAYRLSMSTVKMVKSFIRYDDDNKIH